MLKPSPEVAPESGSIRKCVADCGRTVRLSVPAALLNAVVPPLVEVSPRPPLLPLLWSQARKLTLLLPWKLRVGTKRSRVTASAASSLAPAGDGAPRFCQLWPLSSENSQTPWPPSAPVIAKPRLDPASTSLVLTA